MYHPYRSASGTKDDHPQIERSLDVNALNFCRFSLALKPETPSKGKSRMKEAFLALPNLVNSELADIYHLPSMKRIHSSINALPVSTNLPVQLTATDPMSVKPKGDRSGLIMSLHLSIQASKVALVMGFEDGRVEVWTCLLSDHDWDETWDGRFSDERMWQKVWGGKGHNEAGELCIATPYFHSFCSVMAMAVDRTTSRAFTVSADHLLCRYDLKRALLSPHDSDTADDQVISSYSTKQIGNAALAISRDGKVVAVGGWDGRYAFPPHQQNQSSPDKIDAESDYSQQRPSNLLVPYHTTAIQLTCLRSPIPLWVSIMPARASWKQWKSERKTMRKKTRWNWMVSRLERGGWRAEARIGEWRCGV